MSVACTCKDSSDTLQLHILFFFFFVSSHILPLTEREGLVSTINKQTHTTQKKRGETNAYVTLRFFFFFVVVTVVYSLTWDRAACQRQPPCFFFFFFGREARDSGNACVSFTSSDTFMRCRYAHTKEKKERTCYCYDYCCDHCRALSCPSPPFSPPFCSCWLSFLSPPLFFFFFWTVCLPAVLSIACYNNRCPRRKYKHKRSQSSHFLLVL